ncbi:hypothetical protein Clacol_006518 [Clathrus columnatus]|uniref:Translation initiation factor IF-2, mitochondrial n=1 Tax=Clathrus columnatus TaxID=1419009 RepID=A0AAV5AEV9_9AGAM|nr:hypothetical protein Clacol_006518 [Clathrus columnatus]
MLTLQRATCRIKNSISSQTRAASANVAAKRFQPLTSSKNSRWGVQSNSDNNFPPKTSQLPKTLPNRMQKWARPPDPKTRTKITKGPSTSGLSLQRSSNVTSVSSTKTPLKQTLTKSTLPSTSLLEEPVQKSNSVDDETFAHSSADDIEGQNVNRYQIKTKFKTRTSLKNGGAIERQPRVANIRGERENKPRAKTKSPKLISYIQDVYIPPLISVGHLSRLINVSLESLQRKMIDAGMENAISYDHVINSDYASILALEFKKNPIIDEEAAFDIFPPYPHPNPSTLPLRPPIVTIMGHVDHGKTTLLDTLRSASVAKGEAGGITQHIGAFSVPVAQNSGSSLNSITFLDTPGHAAFTAMRARGARVTDIVVLVVAADDGVMPQTKEVIELVKKDEKLGVVVAINKIDKPGVDSDHIKKALLAEGLQLECFDGHIPVVEVSGLTGQGLEQLVETISLMAEVAELRAERSGPIYGYVLESKVLKGLGPVATVLVLRGELTSGSNLISGVASARVRQLMDSNGKVVKSAYPGMAVTVAGWKELPSAGDEVLRGGSEAEIKKAITNRKRRLEQVVLEQDAEAINERRRNDRIKRERLSEIPEDVATETTEEVANTNTIKWLRLVVKCDVSGSGEAVVGALEGIGNNLAQVKIVQSSIGDITESDVMMAKAVQGAIVAFSVSVPRAMQTLAAANDIPIISSNIIYRLMEAVKERVIALLPPIIETRVVAEATVAQLFDIHLKRKEIMTVAGCKVTNGLLEKNKAVRVVRAGTVIHDNDVLHTLRHHKKDVQEIRKDMECGLSLTKYKDLQVGDIIQSIQVVQKPGLL